MSKSVVYLAHPVSGDAAANLLKTQVWIRALMEHDPDRVYTAPWHAEVATYLDGFPPGGYNRVIADDREVVARLDGLLAVGGRWSQGMTLEGEVATMVGDWTRFESPDEVTEEDWARLRDGTPFVVNKRVLKEML